MMVVGRFVKAILRLKLYFSLFEQKINFYLNNLVIADMAVAIGFVVVVPTVGPVLVLDLMGMPMVTVASQELCCHRLNQEDEKESQEMDNVAKYLG